MVAKVGLAAVSITNPVIQTGTPAVGVDSSLLPLTITTDTTVVQVVLTVNGVETVLSNPVASGETLQFTTDLAIPDPSNTIQVYGRNYDPTNPSDPNANNPLMTPVVLFSTFYNATNAATRIFPPSGVTVYKGLSTCRVEWATPTTPGLVGVRVQYSTDASGVTVPFQTYGGLVSSVSRVGNVPTGSPVTSTAASAVAADGTSTVTATTVSIVQAVNYSSVSIPSSAIAGSQFYVLLTAVVEDPITNTVYESTASGPFLCGFVDLRKVTPTDFPAQQKQSDIALRIISSITQKHPNLDLTSRAEVRDILVNPFAIELANMSTREWFSRVAQNICALATLDDADGDGISDPVATSRYKQQIQQAYGLSEADTQTLISSRFDVLGTQEGVERGGLTQAVVPITFYTYTKPNTLLSVPVGAVISNLATADSPDTITFTTTGSASMDPRNADSYYDSVNGWWSITVPAECNTAGVAGNVGAGSLQQVVSGAVSSLSCTNLVPAYGGEDTQSNADYAAMIQDRAITGRDNSSRNAYLNAARSVPGVTSATVVAAGDLDMLRDWDPVRFKHVYGMVDVYVDGQSVSEQTELVPYSYPTPATSGVYATYSTIRLIDPNTLRFSIPGGSVPLNSAVEVVAVGRGRVLYLDCAKAQFSATGDTLWLDPNGTVFTQTEGVVTPWQMSGANATNRAFLKSAVNSNVTFYAMLRQQVGVVHTPALQPVLAVSAVTGPVTGAVAPGQIHTVYTNDFLLMGGSNQSGDKVIVDGTGTAPKTLTLTLTGQVTPIDTGMAVSVDNNGVPLALPAVRSQDMTTLYEFGVDYTIVPLGRDHSYGLQMLQNPASPAPLAAGSTILVTYNKYSLQEQVTLRSDTLNLVGITATPLSFGGFVQNVWLPVSYGNTTLALDGYNADPTLTTGLVAAGVPYAQRYIKVVYASQTMVPGQDFTVTVDANQNATLTRIVGGRIPDGGAVTVQYFTVEVFTVATQYPTYVQQVADLLASSQDAAAKVLVKAVVASPIDVTMEVTLSSSADAETVDNNIRTAVLNAVGVGGTQIGQDVLVAAARSASGVQKVGVPLQKCTKSDGAYDIGFVLPTGTYWATLTSDTAFQHVVAPVNSFITTAPVLPNPTIPSGGTKDAYVGLLHEGEAYVRTFSIPEFLNTNAPAFYIIGAGDQLSPGVALDSTYAGRILLTAPANVVTPSANPYRVTYQVWGATGAQDISVASTEKLTVGNLTVIYRSGS